MMMVNGNIYNTSYKKWSLQLEKLADWTSYVEYKLSWTRHIDHAGLECYIEVCGFMVGFDIYDTRHWDDDTDRWAS